jgi:hypothetical protein
MDRSAHDGFFSGNLTISSMMATRYALPLATPDDLLKERYR